MRRDQVKRKAFILSILGAATLAAAGVYLIGVMRDHATIGSVKEYTLPHTADSLNQVALSPDAKTLALLSIGFDDPAISKIELEDINSGRRISDTKLPAEDISMFASRVSVDVLVRYCDRGKFVLVFDGGNRLFALDARTLTVKGMWGLSGFDIQNMGGTAKHLWGKDGIGTNKVDIDCSAESGKVALRLKLERTSSVKLIDIEKEEDLMDISDKFAGLAGDSIAISPDGRSVALDFAPLYSQAGDGKPFDSSTAVQVLDVPTGKVRTVSFENQIYPPQPPDDLTFSKLKVSFVGNDGLLMGNTVEGRAFQSVPRSAHHPFAIRFLDLSSGSQPKALRSDDLQSYRCFGSSANGDEVFAYTTKEEFCSSCNNSNGETKVKEARFTVWNPHSGTVVAQSATLPVIHHQAPWITIGASESYDQVPYLAMSQNGRSVIAVWTSDVFAGNGASGATTIRLYTW